MSQTVKEVARRGLWGLALMVILSFVTFLLAEWAPGDFLSELRLNPEISPETVDQLRQRYALDAPLGERYWGWVRSVAAGEFGYSFAYNMPAGRLLGRRAGNTLLLVAVALLTAWALALPVGLWAARYRGGWLDRAVLASSAFLLAIPGLLFALGGLYLAARSGLFPVGGMASLDAAELGLGDRLIDRARHLALPVATLAISLQPTLVLHVRQAMIDAFEASWVEAARGHGLSRRRWLISYVLPAGANPLISLLGLSIASLLSGSLLVETVLGWPGLGPLFLDAILGRDLHVVLGAVLVSAAALMTGNLLADLLLRLNDPRIR